jgi:glycosyltransferase involved in cell wall biosynthesis
MRIALLNDSVEIGGAERYFRDLAVGLVDEGHEVHVGLAAREGASDQTPHLTPVVTSVTQLRSGVRPRITTLSSYFSTRRFLSRLRPDVAHFSMHHADSCRYWIEAARRLGVPFLLSEHLVTEGYMRASRLTHWFKTRAYKDAKAVLFVADTARRLALESWRGVAPRAFVVPPGIRVDGMGGLGDRNGMRICFVGRLTTQKDPVAAVRVFASVASDFPAATLDIYGDGPLRDLVVEESSKCSARARITFHGFSEKIDEALAASDILLLPSRAENLPYALLEAMARACAVVATSVGDVPALLKDGAGVVATPGDVPALAAALRGFLSDRDALLRAGQQGRNRVASLYTLDRMIKTIAKLYEDGKIQAPRSGSAHI